MAELEHLWEADPDRLRRIVEEATHDAIAAAERQFQALLEAAPDAFVIASTAGKIMLVNGQAEQLLGYRREELVGQAVEMLVPERFRDRHASHRHGYNAEPHTRPMGIGLELAALRKDGTEVPVEISLSTVETPSGVLVTAVLRDVTDLRRHAAQLRRQAQLLELAHDAVIVRDVDGTIRDWNRGAEETYGWARDEATGQLSHVLLRTAYPGSIEEQRHALDTVGRWEGELTHVHRDGREILVESRQVLLRDEEGAARNVLEINRDVTERRAAERLQQEFVAMVSHELMNPITAIGLHTQLLDLTQSYSGETTTHITTAARQLERLVGDLLDASRIQVGRLDIRPASLDLVSLARGAAEQAQLSAPRHRVSVSAPAAPVMGRWDPGRLEQVLANLLSNAIKYSPEGGEVLVRVERQGLWATVEVVDQGVGIAAELLPWIFDRFYRVTTTERTVKGLGLGLFITRSLVEAHGGTINVWSEPGVGSTFRVTLPLEPGRAAPPPAEPLDVPVLCGSPADPGQ
ncbi:MAG: PAS domain S-box protein [Chloroflexota bacterium]